MKYIRLSHNINSITPSYGNEGIFKIFSSKNFDKGDLCNTFDIQLSNHLGTHLDGPTHFSKKGRTISEYNINEFIFDKVVLLEIHKQKDSLILKEDLKPFESKIQFSEVVLIKTFFQKYRGERIYSFNNPCLSVEAIKYLKKFEFLKIIGLDVISVSSKSNNIEGRATHKIALDCKKPILFLEDMDLSRVSETQNIKKIYIIPMFIEKIDSSPVTVFIEI